MLIFPMARMEITLLWISAVRNAQERNMGQRPNGADIHFVARRHRVITGWLVYRAPDAPAIVKLLCPPARQFAIYYRLRDNNSEGVE